MNTAQIFVIFGCIMLAWFFLGGGFPAFILWVLFNSMGIITMPKPPLNKNLT